MQLMVKYIPKNKNYWYFLWNFAGCHSRKQFTLHLGAEQREWTLYCFFSSNKTPDTVFLISLNSGICYEVKTVVSGCEVCYLKEKTI